MMPIDGFGVEKAVKFWFKVAPEATPILSGRSVMICIGRERAVSSGHSVRDRTWRLDIKN